MIESCPGETAPASVDIVLPEVSCLALSVFAGTPSMIYRLAASRIVVPELGSLGKLVPGGLSAPVLGWPWTVLLGPGHVVAWLSDGTYWRALHAGSKVSSSARLPID